MTAKICAAAALLAGLWTGCAQADLVVSTAATSNVSCSGGVCTATAANAVLNAHDLMVLLAHGDTTLVSGSTAQDIEFDTPVHWASAHRLTLDSYHAITFTQPVISEGAGGLTITTNDGGTGGDFVFAGKGRIALWNLSSSLIINGTSYALVSDIASLAAATAANPRGHLAFANNYDASADGAYSQTPINYFYGVFEGLGSTISHADIEGGCGLFHLLGNVDTGGTIRDIVLAGEIVRAPSGASAGTLVCESYGSIIGASIIGGLVTADGGLGTQVGGLAGELRENGNYVGRVIRSNSSARVSCKMRCDAGGLVGGSAGIVRQSSATGSVEAGNSSDAGGLVGIQSGTVTLSFAKGPVSVRNAVYGANSDVRAAAGGLVGYNFGRIDQSYATGGVSGGSGLKYMTNHVWVGGLIGLGDVSDPNSRSIITHSYAAGSVSVGAQGDAGGLAGQSPTRYTMQCYSTGQVSTTGGSEIGGFVGYDRTIGGYASAHDYWDLDTSGISDPGQGAGSMVNDLGITGLTAAQLQSGLPTGFDSTIWGQSPGINNGLPYLLALVP